MHALTTRGLPGDGHACWITAEAGDVVVHPLHRRDLIQQAVIAGGVVWRFLRKLGMIEEAQHSDAVVERHHHQPLRGQSLTVVDRHHARAFGVRAAVDVDEDRPLLRGGPGRRPDVDEQAVFADRAVGHELVRPRLALLHDPLDAARAELGRLPDTGPRDRRLRSLPPFVTDRRCGERNPLEGGDVRLATRDAGDHAALDFDRPDRGYRPAGMEHRTSRQAQQDEKRHQQEGARRVSHDVARNCTAGVPSRQHPLWTAAAGAGGSNCATIEHPRRRGRQPP